MKNEKEEKYYEKVQNFAQNSNQKRVVCVGPWCLILTGPGAHPASYTMNTGSLSRG